MIAFIRGILTPHPGHPHPGLHDPDTLTSELGVKAGGITRVAVSEQVCDPRSGVLDVHDQVAGELGDSCESWLAYPSCNTASWWRRVWISRSFSRSLTGNSRMKRKTVDKTR